MSSRVNSLIEMLELFELLDNSLEKLSRYLKMSRKLIEVLSRQLKHLENFEIILSSRNKNTFCRFIIKIVDDRSQKKFVISYTINKLRQRQYNFCIMNIYRR